MDKSAVKNRLIGGIRTCRAIRTRLGCRSRTNEHRCPNNKRDHLHAEIILQKCQLLLAGNGTYYLTKTEGTCLSTGLRGLTFAAALAEAFDQKIEHRDKK